MRGIAKTACTQARRFIAEAFPDAGEIAACVSFCALIGAWALGWIATPS